MGKPYGAGGGCVDTWGSADPPPLLVGGGSVINRAYSSSFRKVQKNFRPYLAIFPKKNANLLGVFLKQYKNGQFFFINFLISPTFF